MKSNRITHHLPPIISAYWKASAEHTWYTDEAKHLLEIRRLETLTSNISAANSDLNDRLDQQV